jgi:Ca-activated chloride channel family protein
MRLHDPWVLALALPLLWFATRRLRAGRALVFPRLGALSGTRGGIRTQAAQSLPWLGLAACALIVAALSRPQLPGEPQRISAEGIDIMLAVDISGSMLAEDFSVDGKRANRLEAVKNAVRNFLDKRSGDRVGLVLFAGRPYTQSPMTLDHGWLVQNLERAKVGMIEDGTAVGSALATAVARLENSDAESKVVVLLTDGQNNAGRISPLAAAEAAETLGYRVYTIAAGTRGMAPFPTTDFFGNKAFRPVEVDVDEETLKQISEMTGGRFFRATDTESLEEIYAEIDRLETTSREGLDSIDYRDMYAWPAIAAFALLFLELALRETWLRILP